MTLPESLDVLVRLMPERYRKDALDGYEFCDPDGEWWLLPLDEPTRNGIALSTCFLIEQMLSGALPVILLERDGDKIVLLNERSMSILEEVYWVEQEPRHGTLHEAVTIAAATALEGR